MDSILNNYHYVPTFLTDSSGPPIMRCIPEIETNVIMVYGMGNTTKVIYRPTCIAPALIRIMYMPIMLRLAGLFLMSERKRNVKLNRSALLLVVQFVRFANWRPAIHGNFCNNHSSPTHWKIVIRRTAYKMLSKLWPSVGVESVKRLCTLPRFCLSTRTRNAQRWRNPLAWFCFVHAPYRLCPLYNVSCQQRPKTPPENLR